MTPGEFHEVVSNYGGWLSHVSSQPARIPIPRSMLRCDRRLQPETWNPPGLQENFLQIHARRSSHYNYFIKEIIQLWDQMPQVRLISTGKLVAREDERIGSMIPMTTFARRPRAMSSCSCGYSTEINGWAAKTADIGTSIEQPILWKGRSDSETRWKLLLYFTSDVMLWIKEVEMVDSMDELKSSRSVAGKNFTEFESLTRRLHLLCTRPSKNCHLKKKVGLQEQIAQKEDWLPRGRRIAFSQRSRIFQNQFPQSIHWSDDRWTRKRYQYCTDVSGIIMYLRSLQGHSGRNLLILRPPPKIALRHDWTGGEAPWCPTVDQQSGGVVRQSQEDVARRAKFFQPTQPIPKPICDRSGQPDNTQGVFCC